MSFISKIQEGISFGTLLGTASFGFASAGIGMWTKLDDLPASEIQKTNLINNITLTTYGMSRYFFDGTRVKPAAMLAGIPLPSIQELSHAMSNRELKYRATGGIFLAHQEGGDQSLRIVGQAFGANRFVFLTMLDFLFLYGGARQVDLLDDKLQNVTSTLTATERENTYGMQTPSTPEEFSDNVTPAEWQEFYEAAIDAGSSEAHLTFPVITRNRVYTNMYIETYEYTESVDNGLDVVEYSIFLRKYRPDTPLDFEVVEEREGEFSYYYREETTGAGASAKKGYDILTTAMDIGYSSLMLAYRVTQMEGTPLDWISRIFGFRSSVGAGRSEVFGLTIGEKAEMFGL